MKNTNEITLRIVGPLPSPIGGVTIFTKRLFQHLVSLNKATSLTCINGLKDEKINSRKIEYPKTLILWVLKRFLLGFKEEVIFYTGANYLGLLFLYLIRETRIKSGFKLVFYIHSLKYFTEIEDQNALVKKLIIKIFQNADFIIAGNEELASEMRKRVSHQRIKVIHPFLKPLVNLKDDHKSSSFIKSIKKLKEKYFLISANAYEIKRISENEDLYGLHLLAQLSKTLKLKNIKCKIIVLISQLNDKPYIENLLQGDENFIMVNDSKLEAWKIFKISDLFIRPTSTDGGTISINEALSFGIPVIASNVVGRNKNCIIFKYPNFDNLLSKVLSVIEKKPDVNFEPEENELKFLAVLNEINNL